MKPYIVEFTVTTVVMAEDEIDARFTAEAEWRDISNDSIPTLIVGREVKTLSQLPSGWDGMCLAYNDVNGTRMKDILPA